MKRYLALTRSHSYSLLFALPLLLLYEMGAFYLIQVQGSSLRNGADVLLRMVLATGGLEGTLAVTLAVATCATALIILEQRKRKIPIRGAPFLGMVAESALYASLLGIVIGTATQRILQALPSLSASQAFASLSLSEGIVLSLGAGLYEELVFRVLLVGGLYAALRGSGLSTGQAGACAVLVAAAIFSAFHYVGPYGDAWEMGSFLFRFLAGLAFSVLFLTRGFGITAWTHALYDVLLLLVLSRAT
jgi:hypothetical protein